MCRHFFFSGTRASCFCLAYPLWNGTHYRKLPTRGFNKELLCEQEGPRCCSSGTSVGFLAPGPLSCLPDQPVHRAAGQPQGMRGSSGRACSEALIQQRVHPWWYSQVALKADEPKYWPTGIVSYSLIFAVVLWWLHCLEVLLSGEGEQWQGAVPALTSWEALFLLLIAAAEKLLLFPCPKPAATSGSGNFCWLLTAVSCYVSKLLTKAKGLHLALDDVRYHKGKNLYFVVALRLSLLKILKIEETL